MTEQRIAEAQRRLRTLCPTGRGEIVAKSVGGFPLHGVSTIRVERAHEAPFESAILLNGVAYQSKRADDARFLATFPIAVVVEEYADLDAARGGHARWTEWVRANDNAPPCALRDVSTSPWAAVMDEEFVGWRLFSITEQGINMLAAYGRKPVEGL
jgi:hypothetical protein